MLIKTQVATLPGKQTRYRFKQWMEGNPEPFNWDVEGLETGDYPSGALCLVPHNTDVTIHSVQVEPLVLPPMSYTARPGPGAIHFTAPVGGTYGSRGEPFEVDFIKPGSSIVGIQVNLGPAPLHIVRGIRFKLAQSGGDPHIVLIGHVDGEWQEWHELPDNQKLTGISGASGWYIDAIRFHFANGEPSPRFGGPGGDTAFSLSLMNENGTSHGRIRGMHGTLAEEGIETLGLIFDPAH
jgi:hypothetical protein